VVRFTDAFAAMLRAATCVCAQKVQMCSCSATRFSNTFAVLRPTTSDTANWLLLLPLLVTWLAASPLPSWAGEVATADVMVMTPDVLLHILAHGSILVSTLSA
jgi:hypothetical protein